MKKNIVYFLLLCTYQVSAMNDNPVLSKDQQVEIAKEDLSQRLENLDASNITLVSSREITWSSSALGCPKPDMQYTQALVPGVLILLAVGGKKYRYHAREQESPFHCADKYAQTPKFPDSLL